MENRIFELGLTVEGTSLYLLLEAIQGADGEAFLEDVRARWQSSEEKLQQSIEELAGHKVVETVHSSLRILPVENWVGSTES